MGHVISFVHACSEFCVSYGQSSITGFPSSVTGNITGLVWSGLGIKSVSYLLSRHIPIILFRARTTHRLWLAHILLLFLPCLYWHVTYLIPRLLFLDSSQIPCSIYICFLLIFAEFWSLVALCMHGGDGKKADGGAGPEKWLGWLCV